MRRGSLFVLTIAVATAVMFAPSMEAQATRTWVSGVGDDANPCSRTAPCKTFAGAISKTAAGGEISTLDPGGFGAVTITKAITINGDGQIGGILASLVSGVIVNAGVNDKIHLRNLAINGAGNGINGVNYLAGAQVVIDHCWISGFATRGVSVSLSEQVGTASRALIIRDTLITRNSAGVRVASTSVDEAVLVTIENSNISGNTGIGVELAGGIGRMGIHRSVINNNSTDGVRAAGANAQVNIDSSDISFNAVNGLNASVSGARIRLSNNTITNNTASIAIAAGAFVDSTGNNKVAGNAGGVAPNGTYTQQ